VNSAGERALPCRNVGPVFEFSKLIILGHGHGYENYCLLGNDVM
jgi:hypothetical protein